MDFINNTINWIKANMLLAAGILLVVVIVLFPGVFKKLLGGRRRVHHRRVVALPARRRSRRLPRSVGMHKRNRPSVRRGGKAKRPWQIKGSLAAKRHMAQIRRMR
jgi:hypothetical protein